jgi:hypothetical protein
MKFGAFAAGVLAFGFAAATPAFADFAVAKFADGSCRAWATHEAKPWSGDWKYVWVGLPSWEAAQAKGAYAVKHHWCKVWY